MTLWFTEKNNEKFLKIIIRSFKDPYLVMDLDFVSNGITSTLK